MPFVVDVEGRYVFGTRADAEQHAASMGSPDAPVEEVDYQTAYEYVLQDTGFDEDEVLEAADYNDMIASLVDRMNEYAEKDDSVGFVIMLQHLAENMQDRRYLLNALPRAESLADIRSMIEGRDFDHVREAFDRGAVPVWGDHPSELVTGDSWVPEGWAPDDLISWNTLPGAMDDVALLYADHGRSAIVRPWAEDQGRDEDEDEDEGESYFDQDTGPQREVRAFGKHRNAVRALRQAPKEGVDTAQGFKRTFPRAFEHAKRLLPGGRLTPKDVRAIIEQYGMDWLITEATWHAELQRVCAKPDRVLQFNIDMRAFGASPEVHSVLYAISSESVQQGHPVLQAQDNLPAAYATLLTVGWVRFCEDDDALLVEEIQSDVPVGKQKLAERNLENRLKAYGFGPHEIKEGVELVKPFVERFYEDALSVVLDMAASAGKIVEMLTWEAKREVATSDFGAGPVSPPRSVYDKLPKAMGMRLVPRSVMTDRHAEDIVIADMPVWWIDPSSRPNPR